MREFIKELDILRTDLKPTTIYQDNKSAIEGQPQHCRHHGGRSPAAGEPEIGREQSRKAQVWPLNH